MERRRRRRREEREGHRVRADGDRTSNIGMAGPNRAAPPPPSLLISVPEVCYRSRHRASRTKRQVTRALCTLGMPGQAWRNRRRSCETTVGLCRWARAWCLMHILASSLQSRIPGLGANTEHACGFTMSRSPRHRNLPARSFLFLFDYCCCSCGNWQFCIDVQTLLDR